MPDSALYKQLPSHASLDAYFRIFDRSIDMHISSIRKKLRESGAFTGEIRTVWEAGYPFTVEAEK